VREAGIGTGGGVGCRAALPGCPRGQVRGSGDRGRGAVRGVAAERACLGPPLCRRRPGGAADRSKRPESSPGQVPAGVEAAVCEVRREHPRWGPVRIAHELGRIGVVPVPSRMSVYRVLVRRGLVEPGPRKRPKDSYLRWERDEPMALWQMDVVGGMFLADGTEAKVVTGAGDHSRYCVIASVVARATGRAVCLAFAAALREFGVPGEVLTDIQAVHRPVRQGRGGAVRPDLPRQRDHPPAHPAAVADHDREDRAVPRVAAPRADRRRRPLRGPGRRPGRGG